MTEEQYYYLLDGREQGPFSRTAIEGLWRSGMLKGASVKSGPEMPWHSAEELGLSAPSNADGHRLSHAAPNTDDPASLVFRSPRERKPRGSILAFALLLLLIGIAVYAYSRMPSSLGAVAPFKEKIAGTTQAGLNGFSDTNKLNGAAGETDSAKAQKTPSLHDLESGIWRFGTGGPPHLFNGKIYIYPQIAQSDAARGEYSRLLLPPNSVYNGDDPYATLIEKTWRGHQCLIANYQVLFVASLAELRRFGIGPSATRLDESDGICMATSGITKTDFADKDYAAVPAPIDAGSLFWFHEGSSGVMTLPLTGHNLIKLEAPTFRATGTILYTPGESPEICLDTADPSSVSLASPVPKEAAIYCFPDAQKILDRIKGSEPGCHYQAPAIIWVQGMPNPGQRRNNAAISEVVSIGATTKVEGACVDSIDLNAPRVDVDVNTSAKNGDGNAEPASSSDLASVGTGTHASSEFTILAISTPPPVYPREEMRRQIGGTTTLVVDVAATGAVSNVEIETSSGSTNLDVAAMSVVRTWRFQPSATGGRVRVPITFNPSY